MNSKTIKAVKWHKKCLVEILSEEFDMTEIDVILNNYIHKANEDRHSKTNTDEYSRGYIDAMRTAYGIERCLNDDEF